MKACLIFLLLLQSIAFSQTKEDYTPFSNDSQKQKEISKLIELRYSQEIKSLGKSYKRVKKEVITNKSDRFIEEINKGDFIFSEELSKSIESTYQQIKTANNLQTDHKILISRKTQVNAASIGNGFIILNIGLLRRLKSTNELAFVIAHELAHDELKHVPQLLDNWASLTYGGKVPNKAKKDTKELLELYKESVYTGKKFSRKFEISADSLGLQFITNAGFSIESAIGLLNVLDSADFTKYDLKVDPSKTFNFKNYPFKEKWLEQTESSFVKNDGKTSVFNSDSLKTHPDINKRIETLKNNDFVSSDEHESNDTWSITSELLDFEMIESAYHFNDYDYALYLALQLHSKYPENQYLRAMIPKILIELYQARKDHKFSRYVDHDWQNSKSEDWQLLKSFLHNLRMSELGELSYHLLNNKNFFQADNEDHYYLLWRISNKLGRTNVEKQALATYLNKFPNGEYARTFKNKQK